MSSNSCILFCISLKLHCIFCPSFCYNILAVLDFFSLSLGEQVNFLSVFLPVALFFEVFLHFYAVLHQALFEALGGFCPCIGVCTPVASSLEETLNFFPVLVKVLVKACNSLSQFL